MNNRYLQSQFLIYIYIYVSNYLDLYLPHLTITICILHIQESVGIKESVNKLKIQDKNPHCTTSGTGSGTSTSLVAGFDLKKLEQLYPNEFWYDKKPNNGNDTNSNFNSNRKQKKDQILAAATATLIGTPTIGRTEGIEGRTIPDVHLDSIPNSLRDDRLKLGTVKGRNRKLKVKTK